MTTLRILAVPYGEPGETSSGRIIVATGDVTVPADVSRVKLLIDHDRSAAIGYATDVEETEDGLAVTFAVDGLRKTAEEALSSYRAGIRDAASPGIDFDDATLLRIKANRNVAVKAAGVLREVSLVAVGGFLNARVLDETDG